MNFTVTLEVGNEKRSQIRSLPKGVILLYRKDDLKDVLIREAHHGGIWCTWALKRNLFEEPFNVTVELENGQKKSCSGTLTATLIKEVPSQELKFDCSAMLAAMECMESLSGSALEECFKEIRKMNIKDMYKSVVKFIIRKLKMIRVPDAIKL